MKRIRSLMIAAIALAGVTLLAPSAQAGNVGISVNIGNGGYGYYNRPVYYQPRPYYARPVVYQPVNYGPGYRAPYYNNGARYYNSRAYARPNHYYYR